MDSRQNLDVNNSYDFWIKALNCVKKRKKKTLYCESALVNNIKHINYITRGVGQVNSIFEKYKRDESCDMAREWLSKYWYWRDEAEKKKITLGSPDFDGQPKARTYDPDRRMIDWTNAQNEWKRRELVLKYIASKGDEHELYALILDNRFVHHHRSITDVRMKLNISERTFNRMQKEALWEAARIIPANVLVEK